VQDKIKKVKSAHEHVRISLFLDEMDSQGGEAGDDAVVKAKRSRISSEIAQIWV
jgi:hypothetical protein